MTKIQITDEMTTVINILHEICDFKGFFNFSHLRATGLSRAEVEQAIEQLNEAGYQIMKSSFGHISTKGYSSEWVWVDYQKAYEYALYDLAEVIDLAAEQAAAVAEVERMLEGE